MVREHLKTKARAAVESAVQRAAGAILAKEEHPDLVAGQITDELTKAATNIITVFQPSLKKIAPEGVTVKQVSDMILGAYGQLRAAPTAQAISPVRPS